MVSFITFVSPILTNLFQIPLSFGKSEVVVDFGEFQTLNCRVHTFLKVGHKKCLVELRGTPVYYSALTQPLSSSTKLSNVINRSETVRANHGIKGERRDIAVERYKERATIV
jgi:hypothetical protein